MVIAKLTTQCLRRKYAFKGLLGWESPQLTSWFETDRVTSFRSAGENEGVIPGNSSCGQRKRAAESTAHLLSVFLL
jgi:hypothetical protein